MTVNRAIPPKINDISEIQLINGEQVKLSNGLQVLQLKGGNQDVISLQLILPAGRYQEQQKLQSAFTATMLKEGTKKFSSVQIAEQLDFYGAELSISSEYDCTNLILFCLSKYVKNLIPLLIDIMESAIFPKEELDIKVKNFKQRLLVNQQKTDFLAQRAFHQYAFGMNHPYGYSSSAELYDEISVEVISEFHQKQYRLDQSYCIVSGNYTDEDYQFISQKLQAISTTSQTYATQEHTLETNFLQHEIALPDAQQCSIRIGCPTIGICHSEFAKLNFANTVLGGYFGSRLMQNLREDKGMTYGIYSALGSFVHNGYWYISTEVGNAHKYAAVEEIKNEIKQLQNHVISSEELELVRNYILGKYLAKSDGPFAQSKLFESLFLNHQTVNEYQNRIEAIKNCSSQDVQNMAQKYWNLDEVVEIIAG